MESDFLLPNDDFTAANVSHESLLQNGTSITVDTSNATQYNNTTTLYSDEAADFPIQVLYWGILLLFCFVIRPRIPDQGYQARQRARLRYERRNDPNRRQKVIEQSLISKKVIARDDQHNLTLGNDEEDQAPVSIHSLASNDEENSSCMICLEPFRVGDQVMWTAHALDECRHVFHEECINSWLDKHNDCPGCRTELLDFDDEESDEEDNDEVDGASTHSAGYAIVNGLVQLSRRTCGCYSLVGQSIETFHDEYESHDFQQSLPLRRVVSVGGYDLERRPSLLQVAIRRVSTGVYSRISKSFTLEEEDEHDVHDEEDPLELEFGSDDADDRELKHPEEIRRTLSEGGGRPVGLFSSGVAIQRSSFGLYNRLSTTFDDEEDDDDMVCFEMHNFQRRSGSIMRRKGI